MSDEESFVILGSSPMSSLEPDGGDGVHEAPLSSSSIETDTPGSSFGSLKKSQLKELRNAQEISTQTPTQSTVENDQRASQIEAQISKENLNEVIKTKSMIKSIQTENNPGKSSVSNVKIQVQPEMAEPMIITPVKMLESTKLDISNADSKLWSRSPQVETNVIDLLDCLSLEDCAVSPPLESKEQKLTEDLNNKPQQTTMSSSNPVSLEEKIAINNGSQTSSSPAAANSSLASSFIMGDINADVLKTSVYSQFPSISMNSSPEDVVKLQNMVTENMHLKLVLEKVNNTMRAFHYSSLKWHEKMNTMEAKYKQELADCHKEIEMLRETNKDLQPQIEAVEIARKKDREETIQKLSEKSSLIDNMRAQIVKLEKQQMSSFELVGQTSGKKSSDDFDKYYVSRSEHELKIKELERKLSELLASNLDLKDIEKQYIDEINCLKVNLTSAEELLKTHNATITQLITKDRERLQQIKGLENTIAKLRSDIAEQNERILLLEHQNEVHRKDFEMEKESRSVANKEKQQMLKDLRNLQKHNQELIEEHQKLVSNYEKRLFSSQNSGADQSYVSAAPSAQTYINNRQRPIRVSPSLPSPSNPQQPVALADTVQLCPICNKAFKSLSILQSHVNDCIDRN